MLRAFTQSWERTGDGSQGLSAVGGVLRWKKHRPAQVAVERSRPGGSCVCSTSRRKWPSLHMAAGPGSGEVRLEIGVLAMSFSAPLLEWFVRTVSTSSTPIYSIWPSPNHYQRAKSRPRGPGLLAALSGGP